MRIAAISPEAQGIIKGSTGGTGETSSTSSFADMLKSKIEEVNNAQQQADEARVNAAVHGATNIHETLIQLEEADISMRLMMKFRNKAMDVYQEVMRMQF